MRDIKDLGSKLVEDAMLREEFSAQRGLINELFPYIYEASKRMSSRAISRWLEANGTKLSPATIAKALRNPTPYWQEILEEIEPAALIFAKAHDADAEEILKNRELFHALEAETPVISGVTREGQQHFYEEYESACGVLKEDWFSMPELAIEQCLSSAEFGSEKSDETQEKSNQESQ